MRIKMREERGRVKGENKDRGEGRRERGRER